MIKSHYKNHVIHLIQPTPSPSERRTSQLYGGYGTTCHYFIAPRGAQEAEISIQIWALTEVWTLDLLLGSPACNC